MSRVLVLFHACVCRLKRQANVCRIYTKKRGAEPDLMDPLIIKKTEATMEAVVSPGVYGPMPRARVA